MVSEPTWRTSLVRHLESDQRRFGNPQRVTPSGIWYYMVLTAHAKPEARTRIPSVVHADGTGRLQIVRENTDPLTYAYLKALGRRISVEVAVNTSFNVAGPIAQTPTQALDTLRRSKGLDAVLMVSDEGPVFAALHAGTGGVGGGNRFRQWLTEWQAETGKRLQN